MRIRAIESGTFILLVLLTTVAFIALLWPFLQPIFWAAVLGTLFQPLQRRWLRVTGGRATVATLLNILSIILMVILPLFLVGFAVTQEAINVFQRIREGEIDVLAPIRWAQEAAPALGERLSRLGFEIERLEQGLSSAAVAASRFLASRALVVGQDALRIGALFFLMLYILFFFLRDGHRIMDAIVRGTPMGEARERQLFARFAEVSRATIKGTLVVGMVQGSMGGLTFWILGLPTPVLWGVLMIVLSMLPAIGASLVWIPASVVLIATGSWLKGVILIALGTFVIGMVDNVLRPILVGRESRLPDYLILLATLGGLSLFGISGFVVGPVIAALFLAVWEMFAQEFSPPKDVQRIEAAARGEHHAGPAE